MKLKQFLLAAAFSFSLSPMTALAIATDVEEGDEVDLASMNLVDAAMAHGDFDTLILSSKVAQLEKTLRNGGPYTIFAPVNSAWAGLPKEQFDALRENHDALGELLKHHIVEGRLSAADLAGKTEVNTLHGGTLSVERRDGHLYIEGIRVLVPDIATSNGVIHALEAIVVPPAVGQAITETMNDDPSAALGN